MRGLLGFVASVVGAFASPSEAEVVDWAHAAPSYEWSFPRDHFPHPDYSIEWWYFTGHLTPEGSSEPRFGYQFTFFRVGLDRPAKPASDDTPRSNFRAHALIMGHAALTDLKTDRHVFSDVIHRSAALTGGFHDSDSDRRIGSCPAPFGTSGEWTLDWNGSAFDFFAIDTQVGAEFGGGGVRMALSTRPGKALIFQGPNGLSRKSKDGKVASLYYSFTRLETAGEIEFLGERFRVTGTSWMDHEISSDSLSDAQVGWDWFSLQFDDGSEMMIYRLRGKDERDDFGRGTFVSPSGDVSYLEPKDWRATATRRVKSGATGADYPVAWEFEIERLRLSFEIDAEVDAAENVSQRVKDLKYWEGPIRITDRAGKRMGRGYLELTGYGGARLPL